MGNEEFTAMPIRVLLFRTPGYLWYLSAMSLASVPFCLIRNKRAMYLMAIALYIFGTLGNGSYSWLMSECTWYTGIFLTTRNGLFFAFPLMCAGDYIGSSENFNLWRGKDWILTILATAAFWAEVFLCRSRVESGADCSMYFVLPLLTMMLMKLFATHFKNETKSGQLKLLKIPVAKLSSSIYLLQYGVITVGGYCLKRIHIIGAAQNLVIYVGIIIGAWIFSMLLSNTKISKYVI